MEYAEGGELFDYIVKINDLKNQRLLASCSRSSPRSVIFIKIGSSTET